MLHSLTFGSFVLGIAIASIIWYTVCFPEYPLAQYSAKHITQFLYDKPIYAQRPIKGTLAKSVDPDLTPQNVASDQGLHCLNKVQEFL